MHGHQPPPGPGLSFVSQGSTTPGHVSGIGEITSYLQVNLRQPTHGQWCQSMKRRDTRTCTEYTEIIKEKTLRSKFLFDSAYPKLIASTIAPYISTCC
ncbi:hypothetical protein DPMN_108084 [Dreissena polymorpha]|uniref:Uncharacterized protein n=1 Tax=Dreissena polymorpha TaxID=45954 RepID=A0A9D4QKT2_DREPO|nr:hypothetical protein DPMN_108084 [Dreissena polymorpha]